MKITTGENPTQAENNKELASKSDGSNDPSKRSKLRKFGDAVIVGIGATLLPLGGVEITKTVILDNKNIEYLDSASCDKRDDQYQAAFFIDFASTSLATKSQSLDLKTALKRAHRALPANGRLSVFSNATKGGVSLPTLEFEICRPAETRAELKYIGARLVGSEQLLQQAKDAKRRLNVIVERLHRESRDFKNAPANSNMFEQIRGLSRYPFNSSLRKLYIHTNGNLGSDIERLFQKPNETLDFEGVRKRPEYKYFIKSNNLTGVSVELYLLEPPLSPSKTLTSVSNHHIWRFFEDYFVYSNAANISITPLRRVS